MLASTSSPGDSTACLVLDDIGVLLSAHEPPQVSVLLPCPTDVARGNTARCSSLSLDSTITPLHPFCTPWS